MALDRTNGQQVSTVINSLLECINALQPALTALDILDGINTVNDVTGQLQGRDLPAGFSLSGNDVVNGIVYLMQIRTAIRETNTQNAIRAVRDNIGVRTGTG